MKKYLKHSQKEKVLEIIRYGLATRAKDEEICDLLQSEGIQISARSVRRYEKFIYKNSGGSAGSKFHKNIGTYLIEDIYAYKEMQRLHWNLLNSASGIDEKIKILNSLRAITKDKIKVFKNYSHTSYDISYLYFDKL